jgi:hypothetical protein
MCRLALLRNQSWLVAGGPLTYFFFHIPKTGGTSFKRALEGWFSTRQDEDINPDGLRQLERERPLNLCIHGHFSGVLLSSPNALLARYPWITANPSASVITLIRDPVEQAVSYYFHERQAGRAAGQLIDFLRVPHVFATARALEITQDNEVNEALQSFAFVGVTDELQASVDLFSDIAGKSRLAVVHERAAIRDEQVQALSPLTRRRIEDLYPLESELYARARDSVLGRKPIEWKPQTQFNYLCKRQASRAEVAGSQARSQPASILSFRSHGEDGSVRARFDCRERIGVTITFEIGDAAQVVEPAIRVTRLGHVVFVVAYVPHEGAPDHFSVGRHEVTTWIPGNLLNAGPFELFASLARPYPVLRHDQLADPLVLDITEPLAAEGTARGRWRTPFPGGVRPLLKWSAS